jgi:hypothetical protein
MIAAIQSQESAWEGLGKDMVDGFIVGIRRETPDAIKAAVAMAIAALKAAKDAIGAHSPADATIELGKYFDWGMAVGLDKYSAMSEKSAAKMGTNAVSSLSSAISGISSVLDSNLDTAPTIRPVVDLTDIKIGAQSIDNMLSQTKSIDLSGTRSIVNKVAQDQSSTGSGSVNKSGVQETNFTFNQTNYSPKALSRVDIYRSTKNQFSALKGLVNA